MAHYSNSRKAGQGGVFRSLGLFSAYPGYPWNMRLLAASALFAAGGGFFPDMVWRAPSGRYAGGVVLGSLAVRHAAASSCYLASFKENNLMLKKSR